MNPTGQIVSFLPNNTVLIRVNGWLDKQVWAKVKFYISVTLSLWSDFNSASIFSRFFVQLVTVGMYKITKVITCICLWCSGSFKVLDCQTKASLLHVYIHPMCHFFLFPKTVINDCFEEVNFNFSADCIFIQRTIAYWCKFYEYFSTHKNHEQLQNYGQIDARFHPAGVSLSFRRMLCIAEYILCHH